MHELAELLRELLSVLSVSRAGNCHGQPNRSTEQRRDNGSHELLLLIGRHCSSGGMARQRRPRFYVSLQSLAKPPVYTSMKTKNIQEATTMRLRKISLGFVLGFAIMTAITVRAEAADVSSTTIVSFNRPVAIPGKFLSSGSYLFETSGPVLQIWSADRSSMYATLLTTAANRTDVDQPDFEMGEVADGRVTAIKTWFREGQSIGQTLIYEKTDGATSR
jgi:hypothetical protein